MEAALKKSLANGDMIDAAQHRHFLKILMEDAEADTPLVPGHPACGFNHTPTSLFSHSWLGSLDCALQEW